MVEHFFIPIKDINSYFYFEQLQRFVERVANLCVFNDFFFYINLSFGWIVV